MCWILYSTIPTEKQPGILQPTKPKVPTVSSSKTVPVLGVESGELLNYHVNIMIKLEYQ